MATSNKTIRRILIENGVIQHIGDNSRCHRPFYIIDEAIDILDGEEQKGAKYDNARTIVKATLGHIAAQKAKETAESDNLVFASGGEPCRAMLPYPKVHSVKALQEMNELFNERSNYQQPDFFVKESTAIGEALEQILQENGLPNTALSYIPGEKDYAGFKIQFSRSDKLTTAQIDNLGKELRKYAHNVKHNALTYFHDTYSENHAITLKIRKKK